MKIEQERGRDSLWQVFIDALSNEFITQTGFGIYAHISPEVLNYVYEEFKENKIPARDFAHNYVHSYI